MTSDITPTKEEVVKILKIQMQAEAELMRAGWMLKPSLSSEGRMNALKVLHKLLKYENYYNSN